VILCSGPFVQNVLGQASLDQERQQVVLLFANDLAVALIDMRDTGQSIMSASRPSRPSKA
jgi:hypothetical protein